MKNKYYGKKKIKNSGPNPDGNIVLRFDDDTSVTLSKKMAEHAITDKAVDLTELRTLRIQPVTEEVIKLLLEWDIKISEIEYLTTLMVTSINKGIESASNKLWDIKHVDDRTVGLVDKVIKRYAAK